MLLSLNRIRMGYQDDVWKEDMEQKRWAGKKRDEGGY
jgi:hypothetical protein